jgi:hypothetical protein
MQQGTPNVALVPRLDLAALPLPRTAPHQVVLQGIGNS